MKVSLVQTNLNLDSKANNMGLKFGFKGKAKNTFQ